MKNFVHSLFVILIFSAIMFFLLVFLSEANNVAKKISDSLIATFLMVVVPSGFLSLFFGFICSFQIFSGSKAKGVITGFQIIFAFSIVMILVKQFLHGLTLSVFPPVLMLGALFAVAVIYLKRLKDKPVEKG